MKYCFALIALSLYLVSCGSEPVIKHESESVTRAIGSLRRLETALTAKTPPQKCKTILEEIDPVVALAIGQAVQPKLVDSLRRALEKYRNAVGLWSRVYDSGQEVQRTSQKLDGYLKLFKRNPEFNPGRISAEIDQIDADLKKQKKEQNELTRQFQEVLDAAKTENSIAAALIEQ